MNKMKIYKEMVEKELYNSFKSPDNAVSEAMKYSLLVGGKRIRPILVLAFCEAIGGEAGSALPCAVAVEFIHTSSLIHDDLPSMDNDDMRRGKPACHKMFSEATALLAGDALLMEAFITLSKTGSTRLVSELATSFGVEGVIKGQQFDIEFENKKPDIEQILNMYRLKTCKLISISCKMGIISANGSSKFEEIANEYGENLGLAFQIIDDILDYTGDEKVVGKPIGSDSEKGKPTSVAVLGVEGARVYADKFTKKALELAEELPNNEFIVELTNLLLIRNK